MKNLWLLLVLGLSACTTNGVYDAKKTWLTVGGVVVVGAIAAHNADSGNSNGSDCYIYLNSNDESGRVCR